MTLPQRSHALEATGAASLGFSFCNFGTSISKTSARALEPFWISSTLMQSGGVKRIIVSCVGLARTALSFNFSLSSYTDAGNKFFLLNSTPMNNPLPRTSFT
ncbi:hypothetical protein V8G54_003871 [Vigna mungo]|uniref:Uncharacterized protein n=1 Tax=Vigna mungo TaxID=3915 RepID=A0AAQ3PEC8_VIGMU